VDFDPKTESCTIRDAAEKLKGPSAFEESFLSLELEESLD
jgi:hypothetical protein